MWVFVFDSLWLWCKWKADHKSVTCELEQKFCEIPSSDSWSTSTSDGVCLQQSSVQTCAALSAARRTDQRCYSTHWGADGVGCSKNYYCSCCCRREMVYSVHAALPAKLLFSPSCTRETTCCRETDISSKGCLVYFRVWLKVGRYGLYLVLHGLISIIQSLFLISPWFFFALNVSSSRHFSRTLTKSLI